LKLPVKAQFIDKRIVPADFNANVDGQNEIQSQEQEEYQS
jgi:hypothetical protein